MTTELIGTLFLSGKRKKMMEQLLQSPMTIAEIRTALDATTSAIMTQIKILMDQGLVEYRNGRYSLTIMGRIIAEKMTPLLSVLDMYAENRKYWDEHDLSGLPPRFLSRMGELEKCTLIEPELSRLYEMPKKFEEKLMQSDRVCEFSSFFIPIYHTAYKKLAKKNVEISIIMTPPAFEGMKEDHASLLSDYETMKNVHIYLCREEIKVASAIVTNLFTSLSFFSTTGIYHNHAIMSFEPAGIQWGKDLFEWYRLKSAKIA